MNDKIESSQLLQQVLLSVIQKLYLQTDIDSILHTLKQSCSFIAKFQRINLLLLAPSQQEISLYTLEESGQQLISDKEIVVPTQEQAELWFQNNSMRLTSSLLENKFPNMADLKQYAGLQDCYHFPLFQQDYFLGAVEFIITEKGSFDDNAASFLEALAGSLAGAIINTEKFDALKQENVKLTQERNHFNILVDVTNTAISTLDMESMVMEVAKEVYYYFGIQYVCLTLHGTDHHKDNALRFYSVYQHSHEQNETNHKTHSTYSLSQLLKTQQPIVLTRQQLDKFDSENLLLPAEHQLQEICILPLIFGHRAHGVLSLAHSGKSVFSSFNVTLLQQIADRVAIAVQNVINYELLTEQKEVLKDENMYLAEQMQIADSFGEIIGASDAIRKIFGQIEMVANSDSTILLLGETGVGKELFARAIHNRSKRNVHRMIKMNCAAIPFGLLESELFGHEKGAFTGASSQRKGRFELAHESSLMLDEVGDIPLEMQPKLLRVLQEREIERLGSTKVIPIDVRLIAATNSNLKQMVENKEYRADLYYRLNVFPIVIPPLRERKDDIPLLAWFFTKKIATQMKRDIKTISSKTLQKLCEHHWPGNVRELENIIERAVILSNDTTLNLPMSELWWPDNNENQIGKNVSKKPASPSYSSPTFSASASSSSENDIERERILKALRESNGIVAGPRGAAAKLEVKRTTLLSRMQRLGISTKDGLDAHIESE